MDKFCLLFLLTIGPGCVFSPVNAKAENISKPYEIEPREACLCGRKSGGARIVGGETAEKHEYPWMVAICLGSPCRTSSQFCGGSLINNRYILTASHCVEGLSGKNIFVSLGDYNLASNKDTEAVEIQAASVIKHPSYDKRTLRNDIALIRLETEVDLSNLIRPVCLPPPKLLYGNKTAFVTGWGTLASAGRPAKVLREVAVPVITNHKCVEAYSKNEIISTMICAGRPGKDSCQGDSGGPLVFKDQAGNFVQIGVVSWGYGCGSKLPGVYTRVNKYLGWIHRHTQDATYCQKKAATLQLVL